MGKLTNKTAEKLAKAGAPGLTNDGGGLYLRVRSAGSASWVYRYRLGGRLRSMGLGPFPLFSLEQARELAQDARRSARTGGDPIEQRRTARRAASTATFAELAAEYIAAHSAGWRCQRTAQQWGRSLEVYAFPLIGTVRPDDLTTERVLAVLAPIWQRMPTTANRIRNRIELIWAAAKARGLCQGDNPARWRGHLESVLPRPDKLATVEHRAAVAWADAPALAERLEQTDTMAARALELITLTACRSAEATGATWSEIDQERKEWVIPAHRMKGGRVHRVPLTNRALELLAGLVRRPGCDLLFPGANPGRPVSGSALYATMKRQTGATVHGLRSTFRDWAAERTNAPREVIELCLAHTVATGTEAAYWRGDLLEKRRALLEQWAAYLGNQTGNVYQLTA